MTCSTFPDRETTERYLRAELDEPTALAFEEHYFECEICFEELKELREVREVLERTGHVGQAAPSGLRLSRIGLAAAAASIVLVSAGGVWIWQRAVSARSERQGTVLSVGETEIQAPAWKPVALRNSGDEASRLFLQAMELYGRRDWRGALPGLREASNLDPRRAQTLFYLGVCSLLAGQTSEAIENLSATAGLGDSPYFEESLFFLGQAYLRAGNVGAARREFEKVAKLDGVRKEEAERLRARIALLSGSDR